MVGIVVFPTGRLRSASVVSHAATVLLTPSGESGLPWLLDKAKGYGVQLGAATLAIESTTGLKSLTGRERPNHRGNDSFPSGHTSASAVYTELARMNLETVEMSPFARRSSDWGLAALTAGTAWARIEAGWHYPSDTLVSISLGNFCAEFVNHAFLDAGGGASQASLAFVPLPGGGELRLQMDLGLPK
jgi:membrane-associated phospholipid phosphatase